jgi:hypothetical protein
LAGLVLMTVGAVVSVGVVPPWSQLSLPESVKLEL